MKLKKRIRVYVKSFACLIITSLLVALSACSSTPSAPETTPGPDGYTLIAEPSKEQIIGSAERYASYGTNNAETLAKDATLIVVGKFLGNTESYAETNMIYTKGLFEVQDVLKGSYEEKYIEAVYNGGAVPLNQYMEGLTEDQIKNYGYDQIPENERARQYIEKRVADTGAEPEKDTTYILLLIQTAKGYAIQIDKFGMIPMQDGKAYDYATNSYKTFSFME